MSNQGKNYIPSLKEVIIFFKAYGLTEKEACEFYCWFDSFNWLNIVDWMSSGVGWINRYDFDIENSDIKDFVNMNSLLEEAKEILNIPK